MAKVRELLDRMDAEILDKVNAKVLENDAFIKAAAQEAYDKAVENEVAKIKSAVEAEYTTARAYLNELLEDEPKEEEKAEVHLEAISENENIIQEENNSEANAAVIE